MNARVKPAVFMPMFATTTTEGPSSPEQLIEQMKAAGMLAGAWLVEGMVERLDGFEVKDSGMTLDDLGYIKGEAKELAVDLDILHYAVRRLAENLAEAQTAELQDEAAKDAKGLAKDARRLSDKADHIYDSFDC